MPSYIGTSIENKPAWMKQGEKLHKEMHKKLTNNYIPTVQELIKYIDCYLDFHNSKPCPNAPQISIKQCLNSVQRHQIDKNILNGNYRKVLSRSYTHKFHLHLAEEIWKYGKSFKEKYFNLFELVLN